jgi:hypothetical protein
MIASAHEDVASVHHHDVRGADQGRAHNMQLFKALNGISKKNLSCLNDALYSLSKFVLNYEFI